MYSLPCSVQKKCILIREACTLLCVCVCVCVCVRERETVCVNKITFPNFIKTEVDGLFEAADISLFLLQTFWVIYKHQQTTWSSTHSF